MYNEIKIMVIHNRENVCVQVFAVCTNVLYIKDIYVITDIQSGIGRITMSSTSCIQRDSIQQFKLDTQL